jgi:hypothetical protein
MPTFSGLAVEKTIVDSSVPVNAANDRFAPMVMENFF